MDMQGQYEGRLKKKAHQLKIAVYGMQYLIIGIANCAAVPVVVGVNLGLDETAIASFAQRTFFFSGCACLLQAVLL